MLVVYGHEPGFGPTGRAGRFSLLRPAPLCRCFHPYWRPPFVGGQYSTAVPGNRAFGAPEITRVVPGTGRQAAPANADVWLPASWLRVARRHDHQGPASGAALAFVNDSTLHVEHDTMLTLLREGPEQPSRADAEQGPPCQPIRPTAFPGLTSMQSPEGVDSLPQRARRTWLLAVAALVVLACEGLPSAADGQPAAAACSEAALYKPDCSGPWEFKQYVQPCYAKGRGEACGIERRDCVPVSCDKGEAFLKKRSGYNYVACFKTEKCVTTCGSTDEDVRQWLRSEGLPNATIVSAHPPERLVKVKQQAWCTNEEDLFVTEGCEGTESEAWCDGEYLVQDHENPCPLPSCTIVYNECRHPDFGDDPNVAACGLDPSSTMFSLPGLKLTEVQQKYPAAYLDPAATDPANRPVCWTHDDMPMSDATQVQAKFAALEASLQNHHRGTPTDPEIWARLIRAMKLLFELKGDLLTHAQQNAALVLYRDYPAFHASNLVLSCDPTSTAWMPPEDPRCAHPNLSLVQNLLTMYGELLAPHVSPTVLANVPGITNLSFDTFKIAAQLPRECRDIYIDKDREVSKSLLLRAAPSIQRVGKPKRRDAIQRMLRLIDEWQRTRLELVSPSYPPFQAATSEVLKALWAALYVDDIAGRSHATDAEALQTLEASVQDGYAAERELLLAAFGPDPSGRMPLTRPALVILMGDAFGAVSDRLGRLSPLHDVGCLYNGCTGTRSEIVAMYGLLGSLHDVQQLRAQLAATPHQLSLQGLARRIRGNRGPPRCIHGSRKHRARTTGVRFDRPVRCPPGTFGWSPATGEHHP
jgi:hypothetical protein